MAVVVVCLVLAIWFLVQAAQLLVRVIGRHPRSRPLLVACGVFAATLLGVIATDGQILLVNLLPVLVTAGLIGTAKAVELYHDELLQPAVTRASLVQAALHESWWTA